VLALVAALGGCGGNDSEAQMQCEADAKSAAEAAVVARYYEEGKIGTQAEIERDIDHPGLRFFDDEGKMLPWDDMSPEARAVFAKWIGLSRAGDITHDARFAARDNVDPDC
jgi:hypothetical protein